MGNVRLSVVIPTLNCGRFLAGAIDSVFQDEVLGVECVVVDGGSTDETREILAAMQVRYGSALVVIAGKDSGPQEAANKGWARASGEVLLLIGADDLVESGAIRFAVEWFEINPDKSVLYGECSIVDEGGSYMGRYAVKDFSMDEFLNRGSTVQMPSCFYRRTVLDRIGVMEIGDVYADLDLFARMGLAFKFYRVDKVISRFRFHAAGLTASTTNTEVPKALYRISRKYGGSRFSPVARRYWMLQLRALPVFGIAFDWRLARMDWRKMGVRQRIVVFGASLTGGLCFANLREQGMDVDLYIDNNPPPGNFYMERRVFRPEEFLERSDSASCTVIIATGGFPFDMKKQLRQGGFAGDVYWFGNSLPRV